MADMVNHPPHYTSGSVECIEAIQAALTADEYVGFLRGQVIKYMWRCRQKGALEQDLDKANWYLQRLRDLYKEPSE